LCDASSFRVRAFHHTHKLTLAIPLFILPTIQSDPAVLAYCALVSIFVIGSCYAILSASTNSKGKMSIRVKWGAERLNLPLPTPETTLGELRKAIAECIHLPPTSFKLIHSGAVMKGDSFPITAYSIRHGSTIQVVGGPGPIPGRKVSSGNAQARPSEQGLIQVIENELLQVRKTLAPGVQSFQTGLTSEPNPDTLRQEHTRLGELLLQSLLRLDALMPQSEWVDARSARKTAVKEVQNLLTQLDGAWKAAGQVNRS